MDSRLIVILINLREIGHSSKEKANVVSKSSDMLALAEFVDGIWLPYVQP